VGTLFVKDLDRFIATHAIRLPDDLVRADPSVLAPLDARLGGADIVALGELNHFIHEKSDFRILCSRYLVSRGWRSFAEELGWSDGWRIDRYLRDGDESAFERLPSFGYEGHLRTDRDDRPRGILKVESYPSSEFVAEQRRFYRDLRVASGAAGAQLAGIDIDGLPGGSYEDIAELLGEAGLGDEARAFTALLARIPGETAQQEAARLRRARALIRPHWPPAIAAALEALAESLDYIAITYVATTYDGIRPGMAFRERAMRRRLYAARELMRATRVVVMGHALHLAKDDRATVGAVGVGPGGDVEPSLGHALVQQDRLKLVSVWLLYGAGEDCQPLGSLPRTANYPPDTLNARLAAFASPLLFFPSDAPDLFARPVRIGHMYNAVFETALIQQVDAVVFLPRVTPLRSA
jgi:erythromycin esterase-like protein